MYTDEDLNAAVVKGLFTAESVASFRKDMAQSSQTHAVDEENFKLVSSFNDIFVVIACLLLLSSASWVAQSLHLPLALFVLPILAWCLAEFFVLKRKMALPAIVLLLAFVGGVFSACVSLFAVPTEISYMMATATSAIAAYVHWRRFRVPMTVAAGAAACVGFLVFSTLAMFPGMKDWVLLLIFVLGVGVFLFAMYWDALDRERVSHHSDVAFWLHLLSAPLIAHPIFSGLGILDGNESIMSMMIVILLYLLMTLVSVVVDRRAFMVSSLIYVLYALSNLLKIYGMIGYNFALTGVCIGMGLLLLSAFWHTVRSHLVALLPYAIQQYVPKAKAD